MEDFIQIEHEIAEFLEIERSMDKNYRLRKLMEIVKKHFAMEPKDHLVNYIDFQFILDEAKHQFPLVRIPMILSKRDLTQMEINYVLVMEAFVGYLNKNNILKRLIKFDRRK